MCFLEVQGGIGTAPQEEPHSRCDEAAAAALHSSSPQFGAGRCAAPVPSLGWETAGTCHLWFPIPVEYTMVFVKNALKFPLLRKKVSFFCSKEICAPTIHAGVAGEKIEAVQHEDPELKLQIIPIKAEVPDSTLI